MEIVKTVTELGAKDYNGIRMLHRWQKTVTMMDMEMYTKMRNGATRRW
jgi:hypothetical protein